ncbi:MAG: hypothetical protein HDT28_05960 [Clostridiales bacterium]|nr:hypothetical protein [Clostridiales bacterium]
MMIACGNNDSGTPDNGDGTGNSQTDGNNTDDDSDDDNTDNNGDDGDDDENKDNDGDDEENNGDDDNGENTQKPEFIGAVSKLNYDTEALAAEAFIAAELGGAFVSYEVGNELTAEQIAELNIAEAEKANIKSIKRATVKFHIDNGEHNRSVIRAEENDDKTIDCLIIQNTSDKFYYYVLPPENGELISRSYYDTVFNAEQYVGSKIIGIWDCGYYGLVSEVTMYVFDGIIKIEQKQTVNIGDGNKDVFYYNIYYVKQSANVYEIIYELDESGEIKNSHIVKSSRSWDEAVLETMDEYYEYPCYCFEKTENGFKANDEYWEVWYANAFDVPQQSNLTSATREVTVSDGKITYVKQEMKWTQPISYYEPELGTEDVSEIIEITMTDADEQDKVEITPEMLMMIEDYLAQQEE